MVQKPNSLVHVEIHSNAPEKTKEFLKDVFDWKFQDMPEMNYSMFEAPSAPGGGLQKAENLPAGIINYILSEDIDGTLKKIQSSGGAVVMPKAEIPGMGWLQCSRTRPESRWPCTRLGPDRGPPERSPGDGRRNRPRSLPRRAGSAADAPADPLATVSHQSGAPWIGITAPVRFRASSEQRNVTTSATS